jgi:hypothetical protein
MSINIFIIWLVRVYWWGGAKALTSGVGDETVIRHVEGERVIGSRAFAETLKAWPASAKTLAIRIMAENHARFAG